MATRGLVARWWGLPLRLRGAVFALLVVVLLPAVGGVVARYMGLPSDTVLGGILRSALLSGGLAVALAIAVILLFEPPRSASMKDYLVQLRERVGEVHRALDGVREQNAGSAGERE